MQHVSLAVPQGFDSQNGRWSVRAPHLLAAIVALLGADNLLLLRFLGVASPAVWIAACGALAILLIAVARVRDSARIPAGRLLACCALGLGIVALGGEGRLFYANIDWVVRYSLLADMARATWPFAYASASGPEVLRAPIGMYLLPALAGKLGGGAAMDWALPAQNGLLLGALLALGSTLFDTARARRLALVVILAFSGMDTIGQWLTDPAGLWPLDAHINGWAKSLQYSSNLTLAFWVPQHAASGWIGALAFLLWRADRLPLSRFLCIVPLAMLWSPLGVMGTLPFVAYAGIETLVRRKLTTADIALPLVALGLAAVPIGYLQADAGHVGFHLGLRDPMLYPIFILLDAVPLLLVAWLGGRIGRSGFALVVACLLLFPFIVVGISADFVMRASITPLAILAVLVVDVLIAAPSRRIVGWIMAVMFVGALTPARELVRAVRLEPAPIPRCDMPSAWDESYPYFSKATYLAPVRTLPRFVDPAGFSTELPLTAQHCWSRPWDVPRFGG